MKRDRPRKIHWKEIRPPLLGVGPYQNTNRLFLVRFGGKVVSSKRVNSTEVFDGTVFCGWHWFSVFICLVIGSLNNIEHID